MMMLSTACGATLAQPLQLLAVVQVADVPTHVQVCGVVSMTIDLFAPSEFAACGAATVSVAAFVAASLMVPPLSASAEADSSARSASPRVSASTAPLVAE